MFKTRPIKKSNLNQIFQVALKSRLQSGRKKVKETSNFLLDSIPNVLSSKKSPLSPPSPISQSFPASTSSILSSSVYQQPFYIPINLLNPSALECLPSAPNHGYSSLSSTSSTSSLSSLSNLSTTTTRNDLLLCCTEIDANGKISFSNRSFGKIDIASHYALVPRDLRKLDDNFTHQLPAILIRPGAILINMEFVKAIIKHDRIVLFNPHDNTGKQSVHTLISELKDLLNGEMVTDYERELPFELRTLEILLRSCVSGIREEADSTLPTIEHFLQIAVRLQNMDKTTLTDLLLYSKQISQFHNRVSAIRNAINDVLECDEDLSNMYLSDTPRRKHRRATEHDEAEILLETYLKQAEEVLSRISQVDENISSTEDVINISLDSQRNAMLLLELRLAMGTFAAANGAFMASLFGMNLTSGLEESGGAFWMVSGLSACLASSIFVLFTRHLKKTYK